MNTVVALFVYCQYAMAVALSYCSLTTQWRQSLYRQNAMAAGRSAAEAMVALLSTPANVMVVLMPTVNAIAALLPTVSVVMAQLLSVYQCYGGTTVCGQSDGGSTVYCQYDGATIVYCRCNVGSTANLIVPSTCQLRGTTFKRLFVCNNVSATAGRERRWEEAVLRPEADAKA